MKFCWVFLLFFISFIYLIKAHKVIDAEQHNLHHDDEDDDESLFSIYFDPDEKHEDTSVCIGNQHCITKRGTQPKVRVENVGAKYARLLQNQRLGIHMKVVCGCPKKPQRRSKSDWQTIFKKNHQTKSKSFKETKYVQNKHKTTQKKINHAGHDQFRILTKQKEQKKIKSHHENVKKMPYQVFSENISQSDFREEIFQSVKTQNKKVGHKKEQSQNKKMMAQETFLDEIVGKVDKNKNQNFKYQDHKRNKKAINMKVFSSY